MKQRYVVTGYQARQERIELKDLENLDFYGDELSNRDRLRMNELGAKYGFNYERARYNGDGTNGTIVGFVFDILTAITGENRA